MSFSWPLDKLTIINSAMALTGDNVVAAADDDSDEWNCGSSAYDTAISYIAESHSWGFGTQVVTLAASPTPPQDIAFNAAFPIPADCVHVLWVKTKTGTAAPRPVLFEIMGTASGPVIVANAQGLATTMKYISNSGSLLDSTSGTPTLILALKSFIMSGIYRGLHEDVDQAGKMWAEGDRILEAARKRYEAQKPRRQDFVLPFDEVSLINSALALTGHTGITSADDSSEEAHVSTAAYSAALGYISESHSWSFATQVVILTPSATAPQDTAWDTAFPIPSDCVHVIWIKIALQEDDAPNTAIQSPCLYDIAGTPSGPMIVLNAQGGPPPPSPPITPAPVTMKYLSNLPSLLASTNETPTFVLALRAFIMSGIYRGLDKKIVEAEKMWMEGEKLLQMARTRYDQQKPKRQFFNARITASRRIRRPWPPIGIDGWAGSNTPGVG
jgi:hypothetical protein